MYSSCYQPDLWETLMNLKSVVIYLANRLHLVIALYVLSLLLAAGLFAIFENRSYWDGFWWSVVTALTIGYGDLSPATVPGRWTGIIFSHLWVWGVIPFIIANIILRVMENRDAFTHEEQEWQEDAIQAIAAKVGAEIPPPPKREY
jgi:hypothetical protein